MPHIVETCIKWHKKEINFVFTTNPNLLERITKPTYFPSDKTDFLDYWKNKLIWEKREILCYFATIPDTIVGAHSYKKIKKAYEQWPSNYYGLIYKHDYPWSCNLCVGETFFLLGMNVTTTDGTYYNASQIYNGEGRFEIIDKRDANKKLLISEGDIVCFGSGHVEIVTSIRINSMTDDDFCSRGGGRGKEDGKERCELCDGDREIDGPTVLFIRVI